MSHHPGRPHLEFPVCSSINSKINRGRSKSDYESSLTCTALGVKSAGKPRPQKRGLAVCHTYRLWHTKDLLRLIARFLAMALSTLSRREQHGWPLPR